MKIFIVSRSKSIEIPTLGIEIRTKNDKEFTKGQLIRMFSLLWEEPVDVYFENERH